MDEEVNEKREHPTAAFEVVQNHDEMFPCILAILDHRIGGLGMAMGSLRSPLDAEFHIRVHRPLSA